VSRITRKELKSDKFALEVEHSITFFEEHQKEIARYGAIALALGVLVGGYMIYSRHEHSLRQQALASAIRVQEAPIGQAQPGAQSFPTQEAKDQETTRVFTDLVNKYSGSSEAEIAQYYLGSIKADQGKLAEGEKLFKEVAEKGNAKYSALAKLSLAQIYFADGRDAEGEKTLRWLMDNPSDFVSKDQATITLARFLAPKKPAEARKLLEPLRSVQGPVSQVALTLIGELPPQ
jgi:predicted negative regulator of RcsB-dependent stress response